MVTPAEVNSDASKLVVTIISHGADGISVLGQKKYKLSPGRREVLIFGRAKKCDLVLDVAGISWQHAELRLLPPDKKVLAEASRNGDSPPSAQLLLMDKSMNGTGLQLVGSDKAERIPKDSDFYVPSGAKVVMPIKGKLEDRRFFTVLHGTPQDQPTSTGRVPLMQQKQQAAEAVNFDVEKRVASWREDQQPPPRAAKRARVAAAPASPQATLGDEGRVAARADRLAEAFAKEAKEEEALRAAELRAAAPPPSTTNGVSSCGSHGPGGGPGGGGWGRRRRREEEHSPPPPRREHREAVEVLEEEEEEEDGEVPAHHQAASEEPLGRRAACPPPSVPAAGSRGAPRSKAASLPPPVPAPPAAAAAAAVMAPRPGVPRSKATLPTTRTSLPSRPPPLPPPPPPPDASLFLRVAPSSAHASGESSRSERTKDLAAAAAGGGRAHDKEGVRGERDQLAKGQAMIREGRSAENRGDLVQAWQSYRKGLRKVISGLDNLPPDGAQAQQARTLIDEYLERAEQVKARCTDLLGAGD